ncbi:MAG TPA: flagellar motor switch protein FliM [Acidimicrobiales bacterium]|nr:flagellar motor switch protein FliM [Acidimicrobiales bacterium]
MSAQATKTMVMPLGREGRPKPLRAFRVRPASTLKDEHEQVLALVGQNFCRLFAADLSTFVGAETDLTMAPVQQWSWDDLLASLPEPYCAARLSVPPLAGTGLITMDVPLATAIVEKLMGGAGAAQERSEPLTEVELTLLSEIHQRTMGDLADSLALVVETHPVISRQESRLELIRASAARSLLIAFEFEVRMNTAEGHLRIAVPAEGLLASLEAFAGTSSSSASVASTGRLGACAVEATVRFKETALPSRRVAGLAPGDVIVLDHPVEDPLTLYVGNIPFLSVLAGRRGTQKAFAVIGPTAKKGADL